MVTKSEIIRVKIADLHPNPYQPQGRVEVNQEVAKTFGMSILEHGLLQTPVCRAAGTAKKRRYEMGDGWLRRSGFVWLVENGYPEYDEIPVAIREFTDQAMADLVLEANTVRQDLNPIDLAWYFRKYLSDFPSVTQAEFARRHQKSQGEVANTMRLLDLPEEVQQLIISREIRESHGRTLLQIKESDVLRRYAADTVAHGWSVAFLDSEIKLYLAQQRPQMEIPSTSATTLSPEAYGPPKPCPHNETITCHKVVCENCDHIPAETIPPETETETPGNETPTPETDTGGSDTGGSAPPPTTRAATPPAKKLTRPEPIRTTTPPAAAAPVWKRKLVLEEKADHVMVSVMREGAFPVMKRIDGTLEQAIPAALGVLADAAEAWDKEEK